MVKLLEKNLLDYSENKKQQTKKSSSHSELPLWLRLVIQGYEEERDRIEREFLSAKVSKGDNDGS